MLCWLFVSIISPMSDDKIDFYKCAWKGKEIICIRRRKALREKERFVHLSMWMPHTVAAQSNELSSIDQGVY